MSHWIRTLLATLESPPVRADAPAARRWSPRAGGWTYPSPDEVLARKPATGVPPPTSVRSVVGMAARFAGYTAATIGLLLLLPWLGRTGGAAAFREDGAVELFQSAMLVASAALFLAGAVRYPWCRALLATFGAMAVVAAVREQNNRLAEWLPGIGWGGLATPVFAGWLLWAWPRRGEFWRQAGRFVPTVPFALLWAGAVTIVAFGQMAGDRGLWQALLGDNFRRDLGRANQEIAEAFGYVFLTVGAVESVLYARAFGRPTG